MADQLREVQGALDMAAVTVATLETRQWAGWVAYFLGVLEGYSKAKEDDFTTVLEAIRKDLDTRLTRGRW